MPVTGDCDGDTSNSDCSSGRVSLSGSSCVYGWMDPVRERKMTAYPACAWVRATRRSVRKLGSGHVLHAISAAPSVSNAPAGTAPWTVRHACQRRSCL